MDNRGNRLIVSDNDSAINLPAVGAAHAVKRYSAQAQDELSFEVCIQQFSLFAFFCIQTGFCHIGTLMLFLEAVASCL